MRETKNEMEELAKNNSEMDFKQRVLTFDSESQRLINQACIQINRRTRRLRERWT